MRWLYVARCWQRIWRNGPIREWLGTEGGEERRNAMWRRYTTTFFFQLLTRRYDKMDDMIGSYSLQTNEGYEEGASVATIPPHSSS